MKKIFALTALAILVLIGALVGAQQAPFKRTILQQVDISAPGREVITAVGEFQPGASAGRHTHFGEEVGYILEGTVTLEREGKPTETIGPGKAFVIPAGTIHDAKNVGTGIARVLATYIVEKGKPLATPVPGK